MSGEINPETLRKRSALPEVSVLSDKAKISEAMCSLRNKSGQPACGEKRQRKCAGVTAVVKSAGDVRPPGNAEHRVSTEPELAACPVEAGASWSRVKGTTSAEGTAEPAGEARPPGIKMHSASTESELAESSDGAGPSWPTTSGMYSAGAAAVAKLVDGARPTGFVMCSGTSESESGPAEPSDEESAHEAKHPRLWGRRHWGRRQGARDGWSWAKNSWLWRW